MYAKKLTKTCINAQKEAKTNQNVKKWTKSYKKCAKNVLPKKSNMGNIDVKYSHLFILNTKTVQEYVKFSSSNYVILRQFKNINSCINTW